MALALGQWEPLIWAVTSATWTSDSSLSEASQSLPHHTSAADRVPSGDGGHGQAWGLGLQWQSSSSAACPREQNSSLSCRPRLAGHYFLPSGISSSDVHATGTAVPKATGVNRSERTAA